ncbi:NUDIX domain-containing protein [Candidatus Woesearchaeota archaeon]|nr:NUDIX domain-containing protein [Candidatus Woesearchaeota archaeon]
MLARIAVKAFIVDPNERVLLVRRSPHDVQKPGIWELPGGRLEPGEDPRAGLVREAEEETGLRIAVKDILNVQHFVREDGQTITMLLFWARPLGGTVKLSDEHTEHAWVPVGRSKEKLSPFFHPEVDIYLRHFAPGQNGGAVPNRSK